MELRQVRCRLRPPPLSLPKTTDGAPLRKSVYISVSYGYLRIHAEEFTSAAVENGIPVLSPYEELVRENHALVSIAARAYDVGRETAKLAITILRDDVQPGELPIKRVTDFAYVVNMDVARKLKLFPPVEILQVAETIN